MSDRARSGYRAPIAIVVALFVSAFSWWSFNSAAKYEQEKADKRENAAAHYAEQSEDGILEECVGVSGALDRLACAVKETRAQQSEAYAYYDLEAQQEMAVWTYALLLVSVGGTVIALVGVAAVTASLWQMRVTNSEMARTNDIAQRQLLASRRPWISVEAVPEKSISFDGDNASLEVTFIARNVGDGPAQNVRIGENLYLTVALEEDEIETRRNEIREIAFQNESIGATVFPEKTFKQSAPYRIKRQCISNDTVCPIIFGAAFYQIPGDKEFRVTEFNYFVVLNNRPPFQDWPAKTVKRQTIQLLEAPYRPGVT